MFHQPPDKPRASGFDDDPFGFVNQAWDRYGLNNMSPPPMAGPSQPIHRTGRAYSTASVMDWTPDIDTAFHNVDGVAMSPVGNVEMDGLNSAHGGGGVGRLVAHFENKGYVPPLPPRPINHQTHHLGTSPSMPSQFGGLNSAAHAHRISSPVASSGESHYGSLGVHSPPTPSPIATSMGRSGGMHFGSFHDTQQVHSPGIGTPFGSMDGFMNPTRMHSPMASTPMVSSPMVSSPGQVPPGVPGTPGFEIWRPPPSMAPKPEPSHIANPASFGGYFRPPVPTTPKPVVHTGGQRESPSETAKAAIASTETHRHTNTTIGANTDKGTGTGTGTCTCTCTDSDSDSDSDASRRLYSRANVASSKAASTFRTAVFFTQRRDSISLRAQAGTRPSREQVPAEAWEQYKSTIRTLYLEERKPLKEVMSIMSEKYGFQATPKMYKTRFSQWGFVKNNTEEEVKRLLSMKFQRDAEGKVSEFVRNGRVVNLGTYLKRKGVTEYDLVDFELPADLPAHIRCRTPTPPPALRSPDLLRAQELVVGNMRKAFLHCRQFEMETETQIGWPSTMVWGAGSSELLLEANFYFEARDADQGGDYLMRAFKQLEVDLRKLSPQGIMELILGMINRDPGMMTALCKYLAAYSTTNLERTHPLRQIFTCLYEVQQKHGAKTLSELLWTSISTIAEELEAIYGRRHPYVARTWADLALFYSQVNPDRVEKLVVELRVLQRQLEQRHGHSSVEVVAIRYAILQLVYAASPRSDATKQAANDYWNLLRSMNTMFPMRDPRPNSYCYHSPLKVDPWTKRCRRRYDCLVTILEEHVGVRIHPYFEEDFHTAEHAQEPQNAWAAALQMGSSNGRSWGFI
ncbi:clr5 domain-containing [Trichoderma cornu-damae]|uniref:Clr5 domain-containing n=1 Tax=Trichoderma cornu-damae TaxID=654480 RepID=A0A9P8QI48_9HYPO|nr:clr5 domain-containing [Trichoderma cornu-damae]